VRPLERGGDKREQEVGNGKALEKREKRKQRSTWLHLGQ
jgi:hypothetical protein